jgi:hypothetical protein
VPTIEAATYADRAMGLLVSGLAALGSSQSGAVNFIEQALSVVDATGDRLMQALLRLGAAEALAVIEHPAALGYRDEAESRLSAMGLAAKGWRNAFRQAAAAAVGAPTPAPAPAR